ncbi:hypothetical protein [Geodermatophilus sp. SYSU D00700]
MNTAQRKEISVPVPSRSADLRAWAAWTATALAFPIAGLAGLAAAGGAVATPLAAAAGGAVTGLVLGAAQAVAARRRLPVLRWTVATAVGAGVGLLLGATAVGFGTRLPDLALQGALTGLVVGIAQAAVLPRAAGRRRLAWAAALGPLWALGWTVTTAVGVDVEARYTTFGLTGALVVSALSAPLLTAVVPAARPSDSYR